MLNNVRAEVGDTLLCKHCHGHKPLTAFVNVLSKYYVDGRLVKIPKTCDKMAAINERNNKANNPIWTLKKSIQKHLLVAPIDPEEHYAKLVLLQTCLDKAIKARDEQIDV